MALKIHNVTFDCKDPVRLANFWAAALDYKVVDWADADGAACEDPTGSGTRLLFISVPEVKAGKNRLHMDITPSGKMEDEVQRLLALGATIVQRMDLSEGAWTGRWTIMADIEGNEFCVEGGAHQE
jgi:predicted enzyme related to lactoylglutathione lyase